MVFAAIRPGGTAGRTADERIALDLGLLGQETTGAGGISYALRSIPRMLELAAEMRRRCPEAWLLNFTNPAGMVTEALVPVLGRKVVGICDSAGGLVHRAARAAGVALPEGRLDGVGYYGLNHLGWLYRLESGGRDVLPGCWPTPAALAGFEEGRLFRPAFLAELGCLPNEYLYLLLRHRPCGGRHPRLRPDPRRVHRPPAGGALSPAGGRRSRTPTGSGRPPAGPARKATWPRPGRPASAATRPTWPAAATNASPWRSCGPCPAAARPGLILNTRQRLTTAGPVGPGAAGAGPARGCPCRRFRDCRRTPSSRFPAG